MFSSCGVSVEGCKFVELKLLRNLFQSRFSTVSVEGCKFVELKQRLPEGYQQGNEFQLKDVSL